MERILKIEKTPRAVFMIALIALIALLLSACGSGSSSPPLLTIDQIADSHALFNSVVNDRKDIINGEFTRFPWGGDTFILETDALPEVTENTKKIKTVSDDGRKITVETSTNYRLSFGVQPFGPPVTRDVMVEWKGEEIAIPIKIGVEVLWGLSISEKTALGIKSLTDGSHVWKVKANSSLSISIYSYFGNGGLKTHLYKGSKEILIGNLSDMNLLLGTLQNLAIKKAEEATMINRVEEETRILSEDPEYQELEQKKWTLSTDERYSYKKLESKARIQAKKTWSEVPIAFDPKTAFKDYVFVLSVTVEAIDGVKIEASRLTFGKITNHTAPTQRRGCFFTKIKARLFRRACLPIRRALVPLLGFLLAQVFFLA